MIVHAAAELGRTLAHRAQADARRRSSARSPRPSSRDVEHERAVRRTSRTTQLRAAAWRATLASASCTMRRAATSTAAGSGGSCDGASSETVRPRAAVAVEKRSTALADRADEPELVERRRAQLVDEPADVADGVLRGVAQPGQHRLDGARVAPQHVRGGVELHDHAGERRPKPVVQVAPQPAALLLARRHELLARALQAARTARRR